MLTCLITRSSLENILKGIKNIAMLKEIFFTACTEFIQANIRQKARLQTQETSDLENQ